MKKNHKNKFKTPEGYFDNFHDRLIDKINQEEAVHEESIIPRSDGFAVPEGYLEHLPPEVLSKINHKKTKVVQLNPYKKFYYSAAAAAAVFLLYFGLNVNSEPDISFEDLADAEINAYFDGTDFDFSSYELAKVVDIEELTLNDVLETQLEDENILQYLDENLEDLDDLNLDYVDYE
ncbi:hypothetical protein [Flagellimonas pacifica]|uniref:Uncharacterized protein n=1 Tax=Flagellimonas pacifica TaxID=1247520 RepID=A0A285MTM2_9FLAO|nr:hypothetical protein [Allomuricauda parva]SNZ00550.1 hypothetical protein SAMN06265377_2374 [Allomuricauda parva]